MFYLTNFIIYDYVTLMPATHLKTNWDRSNKCLRNVVKPKNLFVIYGW